MNFKRFQIFKFTEINCWLLILYLFFFKLQKTIFSMEINIGVYVSWISHYSAPARFSQSVTSQMTCPVSIAQTRKPLMTTESLQWLQNSTNSGWVCQQWLQRMSQFCMYIDALVLAGDPPAFLFCTEGRLKTSVRITLTSQIHDLTESRFSRNSDQSQASVENFDHS